jgi:uncharacterized membrane protein YgcG
LLVASLLVSCLVWAQEDEGNDAGEGARGVARISLINGDVSVLRGDAGEWVAAAMNGPMVDGDHLLTGPAARAEIQFDRATFLRLGTDTEVRLANLEDSHYQIELFRGTVTLSVIRDSQGQVEVDTPNLAFRPAQRGMCRISVTDDGMSEVTVRAGNGETYTQRGSQAVQAGQTMMVRGPESDPEYQLVQAIAMDDWDRWNQERDQRLLAVRSYQYVSPDVCGAADLDAYGSWGYVPPYGWVWSPTGVGPDWAPYREGRWTWLDWYGWTWVSYEPWGWAPYHYGRWFYKGGYGWCWFPGPIYQRHSWSPALVAFFGFGRDGIGVGFGSIGWVPLGPYERYHPWYGRGWYGFRNGGRFGGLTTVNATSIRNSYRNARFGHGISGVDASAFGRGGRPGVLRLQGQEHVSLVRGAVPVAPSGASLRMSDRAVRFTGRADSRTSRFYSPRSVRAGQRIPFSSQRQGAEQYAQRMLGGQAGRGTRGAAVTETPLGQTGHPAAGVGASPSRWRQVPQQRSSGAFRGQNGNWRQFGQPADRSQAQREPNGYRQQQGNSSWRQLGRQPQSESRPAAQGQQYDPRSQPRYQPRSEQPRSDPQYQTPRSGERSYSPRSEGVRINPPIVRERSSGNGGGWRSGGGGRSSRGGGGGHSSGGGGHSSRGGGGHSRR